jgi:hypothetical protein
MAKTGMRSMVRIAGLSGLIIALYVIGLIAFAFVENSDLYGRLTETQTAVGVGAPGREGQAIPTVRLVLHRLVEGENAVDVSVIIFAADEACDLVKDGQKEYTAEVRDGTSYQPYGLSSRVVLSKQSAEAHPGQNSIATQSGRFTLPALASVSGFPFDDLWIRPIVDFYENGFYTNKFNLEIQRALPGRLMRLSPENIVDIYLTRSPTEKTLVIATSIVFLFLSAVLAFILFSNSSGLKTIDELLGVGGYLVAAAGFREVLGISRAAGTSALEIGVIGVPVLVLSFCVAVSFFRGRGAPPQSSGSAPNTADRADGKPPLIG